MKKTNKFFSLLAIAAAFVGCNADEVLKSEVDANNQIATKVTVANIAVSDTTFSSAVLSVDVANTGSEIIEIGFMYSKSEDMSNSQGVVYTGEIKDTTVSVLLENLAPAPTKTTYYVQAYVYVSGGAVLSDIISFETHPAVPITKESLNGKSFVANGVKDAWDEPYNFEFSIVAFEGDADSVYICNLDPYFAANGLTADKGVNILAGELSVSEDGTSATITCPSWQAIGYSDLAFIGYDMEANDGDGDLADAIVFTLSNYGTTGALAPGYGAYTPSKGGFYTLFPAFEFTKK